VQWGGIKENLVDAQGIGQIELNAGIVLEHPEADRVLSANQLFRRIDSDIKMVKK